MSEAEINICYNHIQIRTKQDCTVYPSIAHPANNTLTGLGLERKTLKVSYKAIAYEIRGDAAL
ncbi:hypothetical protein HF668_03615 [Acidithiobacillus ferridurans]|uniref:hypothetical protein n=1 Tax=Acidithiobacillus ferridurans TaxID=1232575 RepID=UPI001C07DD09|nr:hypothetical protein [Acidithiobacillus ferridurans]MBU2804257.1 hypothetical protein [Acidithiobacillus ferridurans]